MNTTAEQVIKDARENDEKFNKAEKAYKRELHRVLNGKISDKEMLEIAGGGYRWGLR